MYCQILILQILSFLFLLMSLKHVLSNEMSKKLENDEKCTDEDASSKLLTQFNGKWYVQGYTPPSGVIPSFRFQYIIIETHNETRTGTYTVAYVAFEEHEEYNHVYDLHVGHQPGTFSYWDPNSPCLTTCVRIIADDGDGMVMHTRSSDPRIGQFLIITSKIENYSEDKVRALFKVAVSKCAVSHEFIRYKHRTCNETINK